MAEHLEGVEIERVDVENGEVGVHFGVGFVVGLVASSAGPRWCNDTVTRIEAFTKSGMHSDIPYVRIWAGDRAVAEFCQHQIVGVYFKRAR